MARFSLHTVGVDRPGIIARITMALDELGAKLEESNMTILHGQSSIMLVVDAPDTSDGGLIERALEQVAEELCLFLTVCPLPDDPGPVVAGESFLISVDAVDGTGTLVSEVTTALAQLGANVIDLTSRPVRRDGHSGYQLRLSVVLPPDAPLTLLEATLADLSRKLGATYSFRPWSGELLWDAAVAPR